VSTLLCNHKFHAVVIILISAAPTASVRTGKTPESTDCGSQMYLTDVFDKMTFLSIFRADPENREKSQTQNHDDVQ
jgi:hypothetical protein